MLAAADASTRMEPHMTSTMLARVKTTKMVTMRIAPGRCARLGDERFIVPPCRRRIIGRLGRPAENARYLVDRSGLTGPGVFDVRFDGHFNRGRQDVAQHGRIPSVLMPYAAVEVAEVQ